MLRRLFFLLLGTGTSLGAVGLLLFSWLVVLDPGEEIQQASIEKILAVESPVYYSGGKDKVGVFFETAHRQYVPYEHIPQEFISGIIAAEDRKFFSHYGIDVLGVLRAIAANIRAGRVVQGGSTITQQTAKNLFKRKDRSIASKLKELLFALRLEYHYPKEKILEFYANQFYVSGNGRGLGVAARYYFNKDASELNLLECAFIAGSVKRPNYYNPFIKKDEADQAAARERSRLRVKYVLGQMARNGLLSQPVFEENLGQEIPFNQGKMYFSLNTIMDMVKEAMDEPEVVEAFSEHGISNMATSGVKVITSIEKDLQEKSFYTLRKELSRLDVRLRGYEREAVQQEYLANNRNIEREEGRGSFHFGRVIQIEDGAMPRISVAIDGTRPDRSDAYIDRKGLMNLLTPFVKHEKQLWSTAGKSDIPKLLAMLKEGDLVYVSVRDVDADTGAQILDLEKYPQVQGGLLAMREGMIRAMVGGMENRYFNRAISARRPMGSVVKPLVYAAALQLGWNTMDVLNNERNVFVYQNMPYFPRPDHTSPYKGVSMSWAGVHSENLATIWLLYHLCDHLSLAQFKDVLAFLSLDQLPEESATAYKRRIRDSFGIVVDDDALYEIAFSRAITELEPDLIFAGKMKEYEIVSKFHYGTNFDKFVEAVDEDLGLVENADGKRTENIYEDESLREEKDRKKKLKEAKLRKSLLKQNYLRYKKFLDGLNQVKISVASLAEESEEIPIYRNQQTGDYIYHELERKEPEPGEENGEGLEGVVEYEPVPVEWRKVDRSELVRSISSMQGNEEEEFWDGVLIDNMLASGTIELLNEVIEKEYTVLNELPPYSQEVLYKVRDFRVMAGLQYIIGLCRAMGIESKLDPVLSFPLGSNVLSLLEVARAYEGMLTGSIRWNGDQGGGENLSIIESIEGSDGEIIFKPLQTERQVLAQETSIALGDILRKVVKYGTGRYADQNIKLTSNDPELNRQLTELDIDVPVVGKTGTANRFTNASFAGGVPGIIQGNGFSFPEGYILTAYVGFDDNTPMVWKTTNITGSAGALPAWTSVAGHILKTRGYAAKLDLVDISFSGITEYPLSYPALGQMEIRVDPKRGGLASTETQSDATILTFGEEISGGRIKPARFFKPYWMSEQR
ncbi:MAG: transglycosylase domain-containing protein [Proteobacteria bacterium]|nr:transglycosylase domain-containing protein [Pseudomonadota bacterium]MBU1737728.1 transglycosylase domain-containing protein [Pseudomonadota bacterium]